MLLYPTSQKSSIKSSTLSLANSLDQWVVDIVSVTMPLLSIKDLAVAISTRAKPVQAVCKGESGALN